LTFLCHTNTHTPAASAHPDISLDRVYSFERRQEIENILHSGDPDHYSRLWMVGFLKYVGYSLQEICDLIDQDCSWSDYDSNMTFAQVKSVFKPEAKSESLASSAEGRKMFLHRSGGDLKGNFLQEVPLFRASQYDPIICKIGKATVTCYYKHCDKCHLKKGD